MTVLDLATIDRMVELAIRTGVKIRPWRSPTGEEFYLWDTRTGKPVNGPTYMIDQAITSSRERRRSACMNAPPPRP